MTLSLLFAVVAFIPLINIGHCLESDNYVKQNQDAYQGLTDRELILTLVKRIDDLEEWNQKQQKEIDYLKTTNKKQERKLAIMERILAQRYKPSETTKNTESLSSDGLAETASKRVVEGHDVPMSRSPGQLVRKQQENRTSRRQAEGNMRVAFYATLSQHMIGLGADQAIEFDHVITNVGNAYNSHTGAFTAPYDGIYVFSATLLAHTRTVTHYYLTKNGAKIAWIYTRGIESPWTSSSHTFVLQLSKNDDLELRNFEIGHDVHGDDYSSFSGFLLYPDDDGIIVG